MVLINNLDMRNLLDAKICSVIFLFIGVLTLNGQSFIYDEKVVIDAVNKIHLNSSTLNMADINNDGNIDLVGASNRVQYIEEWNNKIVWYINDGQGNFGNPQFVTEISDGAYFISTVDFDNDGDIDILSNSHNTVHKLYWYENNGFGNFGERQEFYETSSEFFTIDRFYPTDVDSDGDLDILFTMGYGSSVEKLGWIENMGNQVFGSLQTISNDVGIHTQLEIEDLDDDGDVDFVSSTWVGSISDQLSWFENDGLGTFNEHAIDTDLSTQITSVTIGDIDYDGSKDVLISFDEKVVWYKNLGNTNFGSQQLVSESICWAFDTKLSDIDNDGFDDIIACGISISVCNFSNDKHGRVVWFKNNGSGEFGEEKVLDEGRVGGSKLFANDTNNDGNRDILISTFGDIYLYEGNGNGAFGSQIQINSICDEPESIFASDLDGDNDLDLISSSRGDGQVVWFENNGANQFGDKKVLDSGLQNIYSSVSADLDGDGDQDIITNCDGINPFIIGWYRNNGDGTFSNRLPIDNTQVRQHATSDIYALNLDGDQDIDIVASMNSVIIENGNIVVWYKNMGNGVFESNFIIQNGSCFSQKIYMTDLDKDNDFDVVTFCRYDEDNVSWYRNDGNGNFSGPNLIRQNIEDVVSIVCDDFDNDNDNDMLIASVEVGRIELYKNDGNNNFNLEESFASDGWVYLKSADIDGDLDIDVIASHHFENKFVWYKNNGNAEFVESEELLTDIDGPRATVIKDLDNDLDLDIVMTTLWDTKIVVLENLKNVVSSSIDNSLSSHYDVTIYPNPANDLVNVEFKSNNSLFDLKVFNSLGSEVLTYNEISNDKITLITKNLASGTYTLSIHESGDNSALMNYKLIILH